MRRFLMISGMASSERAPTLESMKLRSRVTSWMRMGWRCRAAWPVTPSPILMRTRSAKSWGCPIWKRTRNSPVRSFRKRMAKTSKSMNRRTISAMRRKSVSRSSVVLRTSATSRRKASALGGVPPFAGAGCDTPALALASGTLLDFDDSDAVPLDMRRQHHNSRDCGIPNRENQKRNAEDAKDSHRARRRTGSGKIGGREFAEDGDGIGGADAVGAGEDHLRQVGEGAHAAGSFDSGAGR